jgi:hypothetical protein
MAVGAASANAIGSSAGAGRATSVYITNILAAATGAAAARGVAQWAVSDPTDLSRSWSININGSLVANAQYDPVVRCLKVVLNTYQPIIVQNIGYSALTQIENAPDRQAAALAFVQSG